MKKSILIVIASLLCISALMGWTAHQTTRAQGTTQTDNWDTLLKTQKTTFNYPELARDLKSSGLLPVSAAQRAELTRNGVQESPKVNEAPPFPQIKSVFSADGTLNTVLKLSDNSLVAAQTGDTIDGGWTLVSIDLKNITAIFDGKEQQFPVIAYKNEKADTDTE